MSHFLLVLSRSKRSTSRYKPRPRISFLGRMEEPTCQSTPQKVSHQRQYPRNPTSRSFETRRRRQHYYRRLDDNDDDIISNTLGSQISLHRKEKNRSLPTKKSNPSSFPPPLRPKDPPSSTSHALSLHKPVSPDTKPLLPIPPQLTHLLPKTVTQRSQASMVK